MTNVPIRIGIVGLSIGGGWAAMTLMPALMAPPLTEKYRLTAVCTTSPESAHATAGKYSKLTGYSIKAYHGPKGAQEMANDPTVDMVVVSVKMPDHLRAIAPAIEARKDFFIEWTPGNGYQETKKIAAAAERAGVRALVGAQGRHSLAVKKVKELVEHGRIGKIVSSSMIMNLPNEIGDCGSIVYNKTIYTADLRNGANLLTIPIGHFVTILSHVLGEFKEVTASGAIRYPFAKLLTTEGNPTDRVIWKTAHDQVSLSGTLSGEHEGVFVNIHCRILPRTPGRKEFEWIIDGEEGSIEVKSREEGIASPLIAIVEPRVYLNGKEVALPDGDTGAFGNYKRAWMEFAKGPEGEYTTLEDAVRIHKVLDAALRSILEGRKITVA